MKKVIVSTVLAVISLIFLYFSAIVSKPNEQKEYVLTMIDNTLHTTQMYTVVNYSIDGDCISYETNMHTFGKFCGSNNFTITEK